MIPGINSLLDTELSVVSYPSKTYSMNLQHENIYGFTDELDAVRQAVYKILSTERYSYIAYSFNYGLYLQDLFGEPTDYVCAELERRIPDALKMDDRIESVDGFDFEINKNKVQCTFVVHTIYGDIKTSKEVTI